MYALLFLGITFGADRGEEINFLLDITQEIMEDNPPLLCIPEPPPVINESEADNQISQRKIARPE